MNYNASMKQYLSDDIVGKTTSLNPHKIIEEVLKEIHIEIVCLQSVVGL